MMIALSIALMGALIPVGSSHAADRVVSGTVFRDINGDAVFDNGVNVIGPFGDPHVPGVGVETGFDGVTVELVDAGGTVVDTQVTAGGGLYSFDAVPEAGDAGYSGPYTLVVAAPPGFDFSDLGPSADHDFTSDPPPTPPDPQTARTSVPDTGPFTADAGVEPKASVDLAFVDVDGNSANGVQGMETGTAPFNKFGNCTPAQSNETGYAAATPPEDGDDCSKYDQYVMSNDITTLTVAASANNLDTPLQDVVIEIDITPVGDADVVFDVDPFLGVPSGCETGGGADPVSTIVDLGGGRSRLICNVGTISGPGIQFITASVKALGTSADGSSYDVAVKSYSADNDAFASGDLAVPSPEISAVPRFDLYKGRDDGNNLNRAVIGPFREGVNPSTGQTEFGSKVIHDLSFVVSGDTRGVEALGDSVTLTDFVATPNAVMLACDPYVYFTSNAPIPGDGQGGPFQPEYTSDNGDWDCSQPPGGGDISIAINNADWSMTHVPTSTPGGTDLSAGPYFAVTGRIEIWYPLSDLYLLLDPTWTPGQAPPEGDAKVTNCVGNFDPDSAHGTSNYGSGVEPDGRTNNDPPYGNNCREVSIPIYPAGGFDKSNSGPASVLELEPGAGSPWIGYGPHKMLPTMSGNSSGDGQVVNQQKFGTEIVRINSGATPLPNQQLCDAFDNAVAVVSPEPGVMPDGGGSHWFSFNGSDAWDRIYRNNNTSGPNSGVFAVEWARFTPASGRNTWQNDHLVSQNVSTSIWEIDDSEMSNAAGDCGTALTAAGQLEWSEDPVADYGGWDDVVMVRARPVDPTFALPPDSSMNLFVQFEARNTFYGDGGQPHAGEPIPSGVIIGNAANHTNFDGVTYSDNRYQGTPHTNTVYGDRVLFANAELRIAKTAELPGEVPGSDGATAVFAGDRIQWTLQPSVVDITGLGVAQDVEITDVLPPYTSYNAACSTTPTGYGGPAITPGPGAGETTLTWTLGDRPANTPLEPIVVCTDTDQFAPAPVDVKNTVRAAASNIAFNDNLQMDDRGVRLLQIGGIRIKKSVDQALDYPDDDQLWTLRWANLSDTVAASAVDLIDVLPFNGDGAVAGSLAPRDDFPSEYTGTLQLVDWMPAPTRILSDGSEVPEAGTWYYTGADPATVNHIPSDPSNDLATGTTRWCTQADITGGAAGCPADLGAVTAIRFVSADDLTAQTSVTVDLAVQAGVGDPADPDEVNRPSQVTNAPNDLYVNRFGAWSATFATQPVESNEPHVQVVGFSVGDLIWIDVDGDGTYDPSVDGLIPDGTTVNLYRQGDTPGTDTPLMTTTTTDGRWIFEAVPGGTYFVAVPTLPAGLAASTNSQSGTITGDEPTGDNVAQLGDPLVHDDLTNFTIDLAVVGSLSIGDRVWIDENGDGVQDPGEPGLNGATVTLTWLGGDGVPGGGDDVVYTTTTDGDGNYKFENLPSGEYSVTVSDVSSDLVPTYDLDSGTTSPDQTTLVTLSESRDDVDFGYRASFTLGDRVWLDVDADGKYDPA
ncbi:MAG: hypothetical protein CSA55_00575, partial [Ilumatobacter coccineus]